MMHGPFQALGNNKAAPNLAWPSRNEAETIFLILKQEEVELKLVSCRWESRHFIATEEPGFFVSK